MYELKWDQRPQYIKDPRKFRGFFAGEGNRTYIPNQFFDVVVPNENLAVVKVVGSIIRFSIGFQNKWGHRLQKVALSYQHIQNYSRIGNRNTISAAIHRALDSNYIRIVEPGKFDRNAGITSTAAVYAIKWLYGKADFTHSWKTVPEENEPEKRLENRTGNGLKNVPGEQLENRTDLEITELNNTLKQQELSPEAAASFEKLKDAGFDDAAAELMASQFPFHCIARQIDWIDRRKVRKNRLGMLRRAIEEDWARPEIRNAVPQSREDDNPLRTNLQAAVRDIERRLDDSLSS